MKKDQFELIQNQENSNQNNTEIAMFSQKISKILNSVRIHYIGKTVGKQVCAYITVGNAN